MYIPLIKTVYLYGLQKVSWSKNINLLIRGENLNSRHFNFSGIEDIKH